MISTMKLVDNMEEQALLEELLEDTKPPIPPECRHLHFLLFTPFRYSKYPSRFRRANSLYGVFYGAEHVETALSEIIFHRLLRLGDAPDIPWPTNPVEFSAFSARFETAKCLDLTQPPYDKDHENWTDLENYEPCQNLAQQAQKDGVEAIRSISARDPERRLNISLLSCSAFRDEAPRDQHTWHIRFSQTGVQAMSPATQNSVTYPTDAFSADTRMTDYPWERPA